MRALIAILAGLGLASASWAMPTVAAAQQADCGEFQGVVCQGYFTDEAGVVADRQRIEDAIARVVAERGNPIAIVVVSDSRGETPASFAVDLANAWGVGDPELNNGVLVLVSLAERRIEVANQSNVVVPGEAVAASARTFFQAGDFEGGILAIVGSLDQILSGETAPSDGGGVNGGLLALGIVLVVIVIVIGVVIWMVVAVMRANREKERRRREQLIDEDLAGLEPSGGELPAIDDFATGTPAPSVAMTTRDALDALQAVTERERTVASEQGGKLWSRGLVIVVDREKLIAATREPLELRAGDERPLLEGAVQDAATKALEVDLGDDTRFRVARQELQDLIATLRPYRVAAARRRTGDALAADLVTTDVGEVAITAAGRRVLSSAPALDPDEDIADSIAELDAAALEAATKTERMERLYERLPASTTRPAVAAALADLDDDPDASIEAYETLRTLLETEGTALAADGLDIPAIAALLMMNNDAQNVREFIDAYTTHRRNGHEPAEAVEYALAGLLSAGDIQRVRAEAGKLDLPVSITAALLKRRDDGPEVFEQLRDQLAGERVEPESARTIAGILAMSLEPAQALRRWLAARDALAELGLEGTYADVAAAFGASDPRGPRLFALSYAAQRAALAESSIDDADRFAPELAHEGTSGRTDTWTGRPLPGTLGDFDPFTLFYYHWVITRGHAGSFGWEPVYRHSSWSDDRSSWWGGGGGFGSAGGSSWGSGSVSIPSFGGFGGGGGFSGGGGGGW